jgi:aspartyl-tRNA(Asn)/glutamyl-tRNA(Gln) amidotransferase subunit A
MWTRREFTHGLCGAVLTGVPPTQSRALRTATLKASGSNSDLTSLTLAEAADKIHRGETTSLELTNACLARIEALNPKVDAFITVLSERARAQARQLDAELAAGKYRGPLHGVPIAIKDNIDTAGVRTTGASALFLDRVPATDATVTAKLRSAGSVFIGKANMHEFALGAGETSYFGPARNPWALDHNTGGSSSVHHRAPERRCRPSCAMEPWERIQEVRYGFQLLSVASSVSRSHTGWFQSAESCPSRFRSTHVGPWGAPLRMPRFC